MAVRTGSSGKDFNFALTQIHSDRARTALLMVPCDWWARAWPQSFVFTAKRSMPEPP